MSQVTPLRRRILVIGPKLAPLAEQGSPHAEIEFANPETVEPASLALTAADLVLIDAGAADVVRLTALIGALAQSTAQPAAILIGSNLPPSLARALFRLKRADALEATASPADLARAIAGLLAEAGPEGGGHKAHCWNLVSAVGGAGSTMLAIETAASLAARRLGERVALFDLNLADGAASAYLGAAANMHLAQAAAAPDRIDAALLETFAMRTPSGFDLFACPRDPDAFVKITPEAVCQMMDVACHVYHWLIIDMPRHRHSWTADILGGSDEILVISELTVPALLAARALISELEREIEDGPRPRIVLNRMAGRMFGPAPSRAEAEKALGRKVDGAITSDWEAAACSANLGGPISQHRPRSKIVKDVAQLVGDIIGGSHGGDRLSRKVA